MKEILADLQEAREQLEAVRSAMADPLKRWSSQPQRRELIPEVVAAFSELMGREAIYLRLLEQVVLELGERALKSDEADGRVPGEAQAEQDCRQERQATGDVQAARASPP
jgi:hypothetical protein